MNKDYRMVNTVDGIREYIGNSSIVAFDFETAPDEPYRDEEKAALDPAKSHIVGCSFSVKEGDLSYVELPQPENDDADEYWQLVIPSLDASGFDIYYTSDRISVGTINLFAYHKAQYHITSAKLVVEKNGEELETIDAMSYMNNTFGDGSIPVDKDYDINSDDSLSMKLILTTEEGYTLNQQIFERVKGSGIMTYGNKFSITDKNGQVVY